MEPEEQREVRGERGGDGAPGLVLPSHGEREEAVQVHEGEHEDEEHQHRAQVEPPVHAQEGLVHQA